mgnify:CR=1 FL=1
MRPSLRGLLVHLARLTMHLSAATDTLPSPFPTLLSSPPQGGLMSAFARSVAANVKALAEPNASVWDPLHAKVKRCWV